MYQGSAKGAFVVHLREVTHFSNPRRSTEYRYVGILELIFELRQLRRLSSCIIRSSFSGLDGLRKRPVGECRKPIFDKRLNARKRLRNRGLLAEPRLLANLSSVFSYVYDVP